MVTVSSCDDDPFDPKLKQERQDRRKASWNKPPSTPMELEIQQGEVLYKHAFRNVVKLQNGRVVKYGFVQREELEAMQFIAQATSIPVPGAAEIVQEPNSHKLYLVMDYVDGQPLGKVWDKLGEVERNSIREELKGYIDQLKKLEASYIGSLNEEPCRDRRVVNWPCGPFDSEFLFNNYMVANLKETVPPQKVKFIRQMLHDNHRVVFTHGDLHPNNILVKNGHITAILDWEMSGWYPEYWEYCKALWTVRWESEWETCVSNVLESYSHEYAVDQFLLQNSYFVW